MIPRRLLREPFSGGLILGLLVWTLSYFGLLPALGILRPPTEMPMQRNALMLGAHLIWGICLSTLYKLLLDDSLRANPALREPAETASAAPGSNETRVNGAARI